MKNKKIRIILSAISVILNIIAIIGFICYVKEKDDGVDYNEEPEDTKELSNKVENGYPVHDDLNDPDERGDDASD